MADVQSGRTPFNLDGIKLIVFDKDGTLIDFGAMWSRWVVDLAQRLESATHAPVADRLFQAMGFDPASGQVGAGAPLAITPMTLLQVLTAGVLRDAGLPPVEVEQAMTAAWHLPDPIVLARPLVDLPALFAAFRARGVKVAVATADDRGSTEATLTTLGVAADLDALVCADDNLPVKPAPDMVLAACEKTGVSPALTAVVGDTPADLQMGRAAGAGWVVGVLSGVGTPETLASLADVLLPSVADLISIPTY